MTLLRVFVDLNPDTGHMRGRIYSPGDGGVVDRKAKLIGIPASGWATLKPAGRAEPPFVGEAEPALDDN